MINSLPLEAIVDVVNVIDNDEIMRSQRAAGVRPYAAYDSVG